MKKVIIGVSFILVVGLATLAATSMSQAGMLDSFMNSDLPEVETTANYEISTYGWDSRVYEWTPAHNPNVSCVFVAANKSSGVACYDIAK